MIVEAVIIILKTYVQIMPSNSQAIWFKCLL